MSLQDASVSLLTPVRRSACSYVIVAPSRRASADAVFLVAILRRGKFSRCCMTPREDGESGSIDSRILRSAMAACRRRAGFRRDRVKRSVPRCGRGYGAITGWQVDCERLEPVGGDALYDSSPDRRCVDPHERISAGAYTSGDLRIAPTWNRESNQIAVPGLADDGTRQMFVITIEAE